MNKNFTKIFQYTTNGEFVAEYAGIIHASNATGVCCQSISNAIWTKPTHLAGGYLWLKENDNISTCMNELAAEQPKKETIKRKVSQHKRKKEKDVEANWHVERKGDYIFIEKPTMCGADLCIRCSINANEDECLPCRKDEREDGKQGYWRYSKQVSI